MLRISSNESFESIPADRFMFVMGRLEVQVGSDVA